MTDAPCSQKALIVDDYAENVQMLMSCLSNECATVAALDGEDALRQADTDPVPDIILLDIAMPGMDGYEVCSRLKGNPRLRDIPVIFLSSLDAAGDKVKAFQAGGVDYIIKPYHPEEVKARVRTHLTLRKLRLLLEEQNRVLEQTVALRTSELESAYERLSALGRVKSDFLRMISHEMRTPLNGLLGISELVFELCPASEERDEYRHCYWQSRQRMEQLLEDSLLLNALESSSRNFNRALVRFGDPLFEAVRSLGDIAVDVDLSEDAAEQLICCDRDLLKRALEILIRLASCFSVAGDQVSLTVALRAGSLVLAIPLDFLTLEEAHVSRFFELSSDIRGYTHAQRLGLAPVVAERIITLFGGTVRLASEGRNRGNLSLMLSCGRGTCL